MLFVRVASNSAGKSSPQPNVSAAALITGHSKRGNMRVRNSMLKSVVCTFFSTTWKKEIEVTNRSPRKRVAGFSENQVLSNSDFNTYIQLERISNLDASDAL